MLPGKESEEPDISYVHEPWKHGSSQLFEAKEDFESTNNAAKVDTNIPEYTQYPLLLTRLKKKKDERSRGSFPCPILFKDWLIQQNPSRLCEGQQGSQIDPSLWESNKRTPKSEHVFLPVQ